MDLAGLSFSSMLVTITDFPPIFSSKAENDPIKSTEDRSRVVCFIDSDSTETLLTEDQTLNYWYQYHH